MRNLQRPGRSPVYAADCMAATSNPLSTGAALHILREGGNAMDAAIAACAVQCVVEPHSTGIGGDCFALYAKGGTNEIIAFNGSGRAPAKAACAWYVERGIREIERGSPHSVTIPGAVNAWARLCADHGTMELGALLAPAIKYARDGYPVHQRCAFDWRLEVDFLARCPEAARLFSPGGFVPVEGAIHRQPQLAETLAVIARDGARGFYRGRIAEEMTACLKERGGLHEMEDFLSCDGEYVPLIERDYRGWTILECPPNGQGIIALEMLGIMEHFNLGRLPMLSAESIHLLIEAGKLAYQDRSAFLCDPGGGALSLEWLLDAGHLDAQAYRIDPERARPPVAGKNEPAHHDTVYIAVVDRDRNAVSFINSLFHSFGSGIMTPDSGVLLHNRGMGFSLDPNHPNAIAPGKRPMHTIIPAMVRRDGRVQMVFGVMGGHYQAFGHAWFLSALVDHAFNMQEAMDIPRVFPLFEGPVEHEDALSQACLRGLQRRGHETVFATKPIGGSQAIGIDWRQGVLIGGSDPRKDGMAAGY